MSRNRLKLISTVLVGVATIVLMSMAFGIWPGKWSLFIAISLYIIAGLLRGHAEGTTAGHLTEKD